MMAVHFYNSCDRIKKYLIKNHFVNFGMVFLLKINHHINNLFDRRSPIPKPWKQNCLIKTIPNI